MFSKENMFSLDVKLPEMFSNLFATFHAPVRGAPRNFVALRILSGDVSGIRWVGQLTLIVENCYSIWALFYVE